MGEIQASEAKPLKGDIMKDFGAIPPELELLDSAPRLGEISDVFNEIISENDIIYSVRPIIPRLAARVKRAQKKGLPLGRRSSAARPRLISIRLILVNVSSFYRPIIPRLAAGVNRA